MLWSSKQNIYTARPIHYDIRKCIFIFKWYIDAYDLIFTFNAYLNYYVRQHKSILSLQVWQDDIQHTKTYGFLVASTTHRPHRRVLEVDLELSSSIQYMEYTMVYIHIGNVAQNKWRWSENGLRRSTSGSLSAR